MKKKYTVGVMIGNIHTDHPGRLFRTIYNEMEKVEDTEVHYYIGTEADSFLREISTADSDFDYQYYTLYDYSSFLNLDLLIVAYGSIHIYHSKASHEDFLSRFPDIPIIFLEEPSQGGENVYSMIADNYGGMTKCIEHLITVHAYQNIVFLAGPEGNTDAEERLEAYRDTMQAYGLEVTEEMVEHGDYSENVDAQVERLLENNPDIEAIASANDEMTVAIYRVLKKHGLKVGVDVAVTGFDNMEMASYCNPALTTVWQNIDAMGKKCCQMARQILEGEECTSGKLPVELIIRGSCGCAYNSKNLVNYGTMNSLQSRDVIDVVSSLQQVQHQSWVAPLFARTLIQSMGSRKEFFHQVGNQLKQLGTRSSYLFLLKKPREVEKDSPLRAPRGLYLVMSQIGSKIETYEGHKAKKVSRGGFDLLSGQDENARQYVSFLLFDGKVQYGVLKLEIRAEDASIYYMVALQLGIAIRFLEMSEIQEKYRYELQKQNDQLEFAATHDVLTGILNRQGVFHELESFVRLHRKDKMIIFMADLDHLKQINDTFGHSGGDQALLQVAKTLTEKLGKKAVVGRFGGDEFAGILVSSGKDTMQKLEDSIHGSCEEFNDISELPFYVNISLGCVEFEFNENVDFQELLKEADDKLYEAKKKRRASVIRGEMNG